MKLEGKVKKTNITTFSEGDEVDASFDKAGRQVITMYQVRDLVKTGYATLTRATETSIISGVSDSKIDIVFITGANTSGNAIRVDIRNGTAGSVLDSLVVPATSVANKSYQVPLLGSENGQSWTAQSIVTDQSDSPVSITMVGIANV